MSSGAASLIRLYLNSNDRIGGKPLYEAIVSKARDLGLAGAVRCSPLRWATAARRGP